MQCERINKLSYLILSRQIFKDDMNGFSSIQDVCVPVRVYSHNCMVMLFLHIKKTVQCKSIHFWGGKINCRSPLPANHYRCDPQAALHSVFLIIPCELFIISGTVPDLSVPTVLCLTLLSHHTFSTKTFYYYRKVIIIVLLFQKGNHPFLQQRPPFQSQIQPAIVGQVFERQLFHYRQIF